MSYPGLDGKRVIVTAGAAGLGRTLAAAFVARGAQVHICDIDPAALEACRTALPGIGATRADVAEPAEVDRLFDEALERLGGLDVLVNNAGIAGPAGAIEDIAPADWRRTIAVNLDGQFHCARRAVTVLKPQGAGVIVNMASTAGLYGYPLRAPYAAAKWGVIGLTKTLAMELGRFGIRVNAVCPGSIEGDRIERVIRVEAKARGVSANEVRESFLSQVSMHTFVTAEDVAELVLFVCSDLAAKISGQALSVDGNTESLRS